MAGMQKNNPKGSAIKTLYGKLSCPFRRQEAAIKAQENSPVESKILKLGYNQLF